MSPPIVRGSAPDAPTPGTLRASRAASLDVVSARVVFRNRRIADVCDLALRFIFVHGFAYAKVWLLSSLPLLGLALGAGWLWGWAACWVIVLPLALLAQMPFTLLASRLVFQERVRTRDVLVAMLRDGPRVLLGRAFALVLVTIGTFFFFVPGIWLAATVFFMSEVMLLERATLGQAFGRAQRVASSAFGDALLGFVAIGLLFVLGVFMTELCGRTLISELFEFRAPAPSWEEGGSVLVFLGVFAITPYIATARFFTYLNVRTRSEGWDIQTRFAAIAARADHDRAAMEAA